ncbi:MAG: T9SS type A sorting domain-containing protein [Ignavibacteriaceae bacterium]
MKKLFSFFSLLTACTVISLPLSAQSTDTHAAKTSKTIQVTFSVNMELERLMGGFNSANDTVFVAGNYNEWKKVPMSVSADNSDLYFVSIPIEVSVNDTLRFNFCYGKDHWEEEVREYKIFQNDYDRGLAEILGLGFNSSELADFPMKMQFKCDMREQLKNGNFSREDRLFVLGNFNDWKGIDYELHDADGDSVYSRTFQNFKRYQRLYFNFVKYSNDTYKRENFIERTFSLPVMGLNIYSTVWAMTDSFHIPKTIQATFSVDMELERVSGSFNPEKDSLFIGGNFNKWGKILMTRSQPNNAIYSVILPIAMSTDDTIRFNFCYSGEKWETIPVRRYVLTQQDYSNNKIDLSFIGFNNYPSPSSPQVEFRCNMRLAMKRGNFSRGDKLFVRGNFNRYAEYDYFLKDADGDSIYSGVFCDFKKDQSISFNYVKSHNGIEVGEFGKTRYTSVNLPDNNIYEAYWEDNNRENLKPIQIKFTLDMELERLVGFFNPATDSVSVRGTFNEWQYDWMKPTAANPDVFEAAIITDAALGDTISFKFFYPPSRWDVGYDSLYKFSYLPISQEIYNSGLAEYNTVFNMCACVMNNETTILFTCNTNGAKINGMPEGSEFKTLHLFGGNSPLKWPKSGWPNTDSIFGVQMYDDGTHGDKIASDNIFSNEITFPKYSSMIVQYKYSANWGLPQNGGSNENEAPGMKRALYLKQNIYNARLEDAFGVMKSADITTGMDTPKEQVPTTFALKQNYPNPFNPNTVISYQLSVDSKVNLKVFDILGNEIATLVNEEQPLGIYQVSYNQQQLSSGVYFYQLHAGDFVQTKKMILLR